MISRTNIARLSFDDSISWPWSEEFSAAGGTTTTGQVACRMQCWLTEPRTVRLTKPLRWCPTMSSSAVRASRTSDGPAGPWTTCRDRTGLSVVFDRTELTASSCATVARCATSTETSLTPAPAQVAGCQQVTTSTAHPRKAASRRPSRRASRPSGLPSTPTTTLVMGAEAVSDIAISSPTQTCRYLKRWPRRHGGQGPPALIQVTFDPLPADHAQPNNSGHRSVVPAGRPCRCRDPRRARGYDRGNQPPVRRRAMPRAVGWLPD